MTKYKVGDYIKSYCSDVLRVLRIDRVRNTGYIIRWVGQEIIVAPDWEMSASNGWDEYSPVGQVDQFCTKEEFEFWLSQLKLVTSIG